jgi:hypothetical protein
MKLLELILHIAANAVSDSAGYIRGGVNGPYGDPETPVRNTGHWLITFARCYSWTGENKFREKVGELAKYLVSNKARPKGFSFHHRNKPGKDKCNGLIGQAWTIEALAEASGVLGNAECTAIAEEVFFQHPFDEKIGLWKALDVDGRVLPFDVTFNHQLWFAACSSLLQGGLRREQVMGRIATFLDHLGTNMTLIDDGLVYHPIEHLMEAHIEKKQTHARLGRRGLIRGLGTVVSRRKKSNMPESEERKEDMRARVVAKSLGYHAFNMYAFALLKPSLPDHPFWESDLLESAIAYMFGKAYEEGLEGNRFGYPYNPPGFEVPYALSVLSKVPKDELIEKCTWWVRQQLERCYNRETGLMDRDTEDPLTHTARIYEVVRLDDVLIRSIKVM